MRLIDADALIAEMHNVILEDGEDRSTFYEVIQRQPTIDAVLVVRCKDCKYRKVSEYHYKGIGYRSTECTRGNEGVIGAYGDSGYCPDGERKAKP